MEKFNNILDMIGNTPLVLLDKINPHKNVQILAKLESFNPGGSIKDRPALNMILKGEESGELTSERIILEATSGNTGIGLSLVAAVKGYRILLVMSEAVSEERKRILKAMGADLKFTPAHLGTDGAIEFVYNLIREEPDKYWLADQFNNEANWKSHYDVTAMEIWDQTGGDLNAIVATMGTTGTLMGLARRYKEIAPEVEIIGVEPYLGHKIQGLKNMKESYQPGIFERTRADRIVNIDDDEAYHTARLLAKEEGLFVGMSSGAAMAIALKAAEQMDEGRIVVILPDGGERYLSTTLFTDKKKSGLRLYNTFTRQKEEIVPINENKIGMYSCGPTLCQLLQIGHSRRFVFADLVRRYLEFKKIDVTYVMNLTDIDDRTIEGADRAGQSLKNFTEGYYDEFMKDFKLLGIKDANHYPRASEHVDDMISMTGKLVDRGYAYEKLRSVYYDISRFKDYGKLSRIDLDKIHLGKTVDLEQYEKENPRDFTLLKRSTLMELKKGISYQTKWGNVRPSWHLECPAMAKKYLGDVYDLHISSIDLIFPHHENAIAISQGLTGKPLANYWIHNELVMVNGKKAAPDDGDVNTIRDLVEKGFSGREIRYWLLSRHYRKPMVFAWEKLEKARNTIAHLDGFIHKLYSTGNGSPDPEMDQRVYNLNQAFTESLDEDFNTAPALAALFDFIKQVNKIMDKSGLSPIDRDKIKDVLENINSVLGIMEFDQPEKDDEIDELVKQREGARKAEDWEKADRIRKELADKGVEVLDTKDGPVWRKV